MDTVFAYEYLIYAIMMLGGIMAIIAFKYLNTNRLVHLAMYMAFLILGTILLYLTPSPGFPINSLPADGTYSIYLPEDGYFVILEKNSEDPRLKPTLVQLNPKYVQYEKSEETPMMIIEPRSAHDNWPGKKVVINLPYSVKNQPPN